MEMETVSFGNHVSSPFKEGCPRRVTYALAKVFVLYHIGNAQVFSNKNVVFVMQYLRQLSGSDLR